MLDDKLLIWQFNRGRVEALHRIYEKYKHDLVTLAASLLTDLALAEDVVHDVFVGFIRSAGRFQLTGSLKGYLSTCVANAARNCNKAERRRRHVPIEDADLPGPGGRSVRRRRSCWMRSSDACRGPSINCPTSSGRSWSCGSTPV